MIQEPLEILRLAYVTTIGTSVRIDLTGEQMRTALSQCDENGKYGKIFEIGCSGIEEDPKLNPNNRQIYEAVYTRDGKTDPEILVQDSHQSIPVKYEDFRREGHPSVLAREVTLRHVNLKSLDGKC